MKQKTTSNYQVLLNVFVRNLRTDARRRISKEHNRAILETCSFIVQLLEHIGLVVRMSVSG